MEVGKRGENNYYYFPGSIYDWLKDVVYVCERLDELMRWRFAVECGVTGRYDVIGGGGAACWLQCGGVLAGYRSWREDLGQILGCKSDTNAIVLDAMAF